MESSLTFKIEENATSTQTNKFGHAFKECKGTARLVIDGVEHRYPISLCQHAETVTVYWIGNTRAFYANSSRPTLAFPLVFVEDLEEFKIFDPKKPDGRSGNATQKPLDLRAPDDAWRAHNIQEFVRMEFSGLINFPSKTDEVEKEVIIAMLKTFVGANFDRALMAGEHNQSATVSGLVKQEIERRKRLGIWNPRYRKGDGQLRSTVEAEALLQTKNEINTRPESSIRKASEQRITGDAQGKVIAVDEQFDFLVVNIGESGGARLNGALTIRRSGKLIANAHITSVRASSSIANIDTGSQKEKVMVGDDVLFAIKP